MFSSMVRRPRFRENEAPLEVAEFMMLLYTSTERTDTFCFASG